MKRLIVLALLALTGCGHGLDYSDGERAGTLTKFSRKGIMCRTWEGEMALGGFKQGSTSDGGLTLMANLWQFTAEQPTDIAALNGAIGKRVKVRYHQGMMSGPCTSDSGYFVRSVEVQEQP